MNKRMLKSVMALKGYNSGKLAIKIGISPQSFSKKVNGKSEFTASEITSIAKVLEIRDVNEIFFADLVS